MNGSGSMNEVASQMHMRMALLLDLGFPVGVGLAKMDRGFDGVDLVVRLLGLREELRDGVVDDVAHSSD